MTKPQAKQYPVKASGTPSPAKLKSPPAHGYAVGFSPRKPIKKEVKSGNRVVHILYIIRILGGAFEIVLMDHGRNPNDDGYWPYTLNNVRGGGSFEGRNNVVHSDDRLIDIGFVSVHIRRGPNGEALKNASVANGVQWNRRVMMKLNTPEEVSNGRTDEQMMETLSTVRKFTIDWNHRIDGPSRIPNQYDCAPPVHNRNPQDGEYVSLDHYLLDRDVIEAMESYCSILSPTFAVEHPSIAAMYFNPFRETYPPEVHQYGFVDGVTGNANIIAANARGG